MKTLLLEKHFPCVSCTSGLCGSILNHEVQCRRRHPYFFCLIGPTSRICSLVFVSETGSYIYSPRRCTRSETNTWRAQMRNYCAGPGNSKMSGEELQPFTSMVLDLFAIESAGIPNRVSRSYFSFISNPSSNSLAVQRQPQYVIKNN